MLPVNLFSNNPLIAAALSGGAGRQDSFHMPNHRKSGPGRKHRQGKTDKDRTVRPAGVHFSAYGRGLQNHFDRAGSSKRAG